MIALLITILLLWVGFALFPPLAVFVIVYMILVALTGSR